MAYVEMCWIKWIPSDTLAFSLPVVFIGAITLREYVAKQEFWGSSIDSFTKIPYLTVFGSYLSLVLPHLEYVAQPGDTRTQCNINKLETVQP